MLLRLSSSVSVPVWSRSSPSFAVVAAPSAFPLAAFGGFLLQRWTAGHSTRRYGNTTHIQLERGTHLIFIGGRTLWVVSSRQRRVARSSSGHEDRK